MDYIAPWLETISWSKPNQETVFLIMRHGEVEGNNPKNENEYIMTGSRTDLSLNQRGMAQAEKIARKIYFLQEQGLIKIAAIYSSPLKRASETANYLSHMLELPVQYRTDLREIDWGDADGQLVKTKHEKWDQAEQLITELMPDRKARWDHLPPIPNAEKYNQVLAKVHSELHSISKIHKDNIVLIVTHGRVIKNLLIDSNNFDERYMPYPQNCGIAVFRTNQGSLDFIEIRNNSSQRK